MTTKDGLNQLAFEHGQPSDNGDGYLFTQEQFDEFVDSVISEQAEEKQIMTDRWNRGVTERDRLRGLLRENGISYS